MDLLSRQIQGYLLIILSTLAAADSMEVGLQSAASALLFLHYASVTITISQLESHLSFTYQ